MRKKYTFPGLLLLVAVLLLVSACGGSSVTAGQLLSNSATAMKQVKSLHLDMTATEGFSISGLPSSGTSSSIPSSLNINLKASGDEVLPDQSSLKLTAGGIPGLSNFAFSEIVKGSQVYIQNAHGQWYVIDKSELTGSSNSTFSSLFSSASVPDFNKLLELVQKDVTVADHGDESLNGANLRHITVTLDKNGLSSLLNSTGQFQGITGQTLDSLFSSLKNFGATLDFWFDESTSYIHRMEMKLNLGLDLSKFVTPTPGATTGSPAGISLNADIVVDLSKFNDPSIKITAPANAIQTDNPATIFGGA